MEPMEAEENGFKGKEWREVEYVMGKSEGIYYELKHLSGHENEQVSGYMV